MIRRCTFATLLGAVTMLVMLAGQSPIARQLGSSSGSAGPTKLAGRTQTQLPDGRLLLLGGHGPNGVLASAAFFDPATQLVTELPETMIEARTGHTATVLPDGSVLIVGGRGESGEPLKTAERFDPSTSAFSAVIMPDAEERAGHTATLLTDGRVLIAGGLGNPSRGPLLSELWDVTAGTLTKTDAPVVRTGHAAELQSDGRVLITRGTDATGLAVDGADVFDPGTGLFALSPIVRSDDTALRVTEVRPQNGAIDVPLTATIAIRLSHTARINSLTSAHIVLNGPAGPIASHVVGAENGQLAFVRAADDLRPNTTYVVRMDDVVDERGARADYSWSFTTVNVMNVDGSEVWLPGDSDGNGWRTNFPPSRWQQFPPLHAPDGVTAIAGQVLRLNGDPLPNVTLELAGETTRTDGTGRFLVPVIGYSGTHGELWVDGRTAKRPHETYGTFEIRVPIRSGQTTPLPYTIWMPALDTAHAVTIPSPTPTQTVVTTPTIPGLELHLPPNTVIRDHEGQVVREITITPVPLDRPPFPLPGVEVPLYFTIQPGGAYVHVYGGQGANGARLVYPNGMRLPPASVLDFWHYDPEDRGWYVYGQGHVTATGQQVVPDPGVAFYEFTGAMAANPAFAPATGPRAGGAVEMGDPVDLNTGLFMMRKTDIALPDVVPIALTRTYRQADSRSRAFGIGATHPYDVFLVGNINPYTFFDLILESGSRIHFDRISAGSSFQDAVYEHVSTPTIWYKARIHWNGVIGWTLTRKDGMVMRFGDGFQSPTPQHAAVRDITDRYGNTIVLQRDANDNLIRITSPNGRYLTLSYDTSARITQVTDNINRTVAYQYDASGRLWKVTDPEGAVTEYTYDSSHRMLTLKDGRGITFLVNEYNADSRVIRQTHPDGHTYEFAYTLDAQGRVIRTDVTNPRGFVRRVTFNTAGYPLTDTEAVGTPLERTTTFTRESGTQRVTMITDGLNRRTVFTYDASGHVQDVTRMAGTQEAATTTFAYEPAFFQVASVTDPLSHTWTAAYDETGLLTGFSDPLGHSWDVTMNASGQVTSMASPLQQTWSIGYSAGLASTITDPVGAVSRQFLDGVGRPVTLTDAGGHTHSLQWDRVNQMSIAADPLGGQTVMAHDANGNLLSLADTLQHFTNYAYDEFDRIQARNDPLTQSTQYAYDANGNLIQTTDRKGQVTQYVYDALDRLSQVTFDDGSTIAYTYDASDRLTQVVDSLNGTVTRAYDTFNRLTQETTGDGVVDYTYDAAGRRTSITVAGQPSIGYGYDDANRLTSIQQGGASVAIAYDEANRRTSVSYPNGIVSALGYDAANRLVSLTYALGSTTLGSLTYTYDLVGNPIGVGGSWARTGIPAPLSSAIYDAANRLVSWDGLAFSYDPNGNLTSDSAMTFTWNARNQLSGLAGGAAASFAYDAFGRRRGKSVGGNATTFLYDGFNAVQERAGGATVQHLTGLGLDETFTRTDASGMSALLVDGSGSTVALADASGNVRTEYTFAPFGATTSSGAASTNSTQFTGRENDGTGLYFYRARYYSPRLARFISEDPIGFAGGQLNLHAYVGNSPVGNTDATGMSLFYIHWWETYNAAVSVGFPREDAWLLARQVSAVDREPGAQGTDAQHANGHGMGGTLSGRKSERPQDPCEAYYGTAEYMTTADLFHALHAIQDSYVHGYALWTGARVLGVQVAYPGARHLYNDAWYSRDAERATANFLRTLGGDPYNRGRFLGPPPASCQ